MNYFRSNHIFIKSLFLITIICDIYFKIYIINLQIPKLYDNHD